MPKGKTSRPLTKDERKMNKETAFGKQRGTAQSKANERVRKDPKAILPKATPAELRKRERYKGGK